MHGRLINQQNRSWNKTNQGSNTGKYNKSLKESRETYYKGIHKCNENTENNNYSK